MKFILRTRSHVGVWVLALSLTVSVLGAPSAFAAYQNISFDNPSDLTTYFTPGSSPVFTNQSTGGINNSGSVNVPVGSQDVWTAKNNYPVGGIGDVYTFSGYFHIVSNSGYGDLGISSSSSSDADGYGQPTSGLGIAFHGGGAYVISNGAIAENYDWYATQGDLELGNWYYVEFQITRTAATAYDVTLRIYNTDSSGEIGSLFTQQSSSAVVNASLAAASNVYPFMGAGGARVDVFDGISLTSATVQPGNPIVSNDDTSAVTANTAQISGTVSNDQGSAVTSRGVCYSVTPGASTGTCVPASAAGTGSFTVSISGLAPATQYYIQTFATNANGTSYSTESTFTTLAGSGGGGVTPPVDPGAGVVSPGVSSVTPATQALLAPDAGVAPGQSGMFTIILMIAGVAVTGSYLAYRSYVK